MSANKTISPKSILGANSLNELAKKLYTPKAVEQENYYSDELTMFEKTKEPSLEGLQFSIEVSGQNGTSGSISTAMKRSGSIGTYVGYTANVVGAYTYGEISEKVLLQANSQEKTFLIQKIKDLVRKSKREHRDKLNSMLFSKEGELGSVKSAVDATDKIVVSDISQLQKLKIDEVIEIYAKDTVANGVVTAGAKRGSAYVVKEIADVNSANPAIVVRALNTDGTEKTVAASTPSTDGVVATDVIWHEGDRAVYRTKFYGIYFWSPDSASRDVDVLSGKLKRSLYPDRLSGQYSSVDLSGTGDNILYDAISKVATNASTAGVEIDCAFVHPRVLSVLDREQHSIDRQKTGEKLLVGDRKNPSIMIGGQTVELKMSLRADSSKIIFFKKKSTFKLMTVGSDIAELDNKDGLTFIRGESIALNQFVYTYKLRSFFNLCCVKPKDLIQLKLTNLSTKFAA